MVSTTTLLLASFALATFHAQAIDTRLRGRSSQALHIVSGEETCADLENKGAYFATKVAIGTPEGKSKKQEFDLVADTGSDSVIVTSCVCVKSHMCSSKDTCFTGTNRSSTFLLEEFRVNKSDHSEKAKKAPLGVAMTFGSGTVMSIIASDKVEVAGKMANMDHGLLLMVDRRMLKIQGTFEGILGLGPPDTNASEALHQKHGAHYKNQITDQKDESENVSLITPIGAHVEKAQDGMRYAPRLFMKEAGVQRYSLCFNDAGDPGAMRINVPPFKQSLPTIGTFHWGLGLFGVSVGNKDTIGEKSPFVCGGDELKKGMTSPCGAIPDSGTTLLMGPKDHIIKLFSTLCDEWGRCTDAIANKKYGVKHGEDKATAFQKVLFSCADWKTKDKGIGELPSMFFTVGQPDKQQKLEISPWAYVVETEQELYKHHVQYMFGIIPVDIPTPTGKTQHVCVPSLGQQEYNTKDNGPVWIMGHPLFYQFHVGYNLGKFSKAQGASGPMEMAFTKEKCTTCSDGKTSLLSSEDNLYSNADARARATRRSYHPPRVAHYDTSLPL